MFVGDGMLKCPDGKLRRVSYFHKNGESYATRTLGYTLVSIKVKNQVLKGWATSEGLFVPHRLCSTLAWFTQMGVLGKEWTAAAKNEDELNLMAGRKRAVNHHKADCAPPKPHPDADPVAWAETVSKYYQFRELDDGLGVHGTVMDSVFYPDPDCPNAPYWPTTQSP